ncbi:hypothetical protein RFI_17421, partial [Reticulomyxa filosa]
EEEASHIVLPQATQNRELQSSSMQVELPPGVGTVVWYLCQLLLGLSSKMSTFTSGDGSSGSGQNKDEDKANMEHISSETQRTAKLLLEHILSKWCDLDLAHLTDSILPYWTPPQYQEKSQQKKQAKKEKLDKKQK